MAPPGLLPSFKGRSEAAALHTGFQAGLWDQHIHCVCESEVTKMACVHHTEKETTNGGAGRDQQKVRTKLCSTNIEYVTLPWHMCIVSKWTEEKMFKICLTDRTT